MAGDLNRIRDVLSANRQKLLKRGRVVATGIGYKQTRGAKTDRLSIVCSVEEKIPLSRVKERDRVPATIDGAPTDVIQTGVVRAFEAPTNRFRPTPGGVSIGHVETTAGTLGCWVSKNGRKVLLSNNHVIANSNIANNGDIILQPGPFDGGTSSKDHFANLAEFVPISFEGEPGKSHFAKAVTAFLNLGCKVMGSTIRYKVTKAQSQDNLVDAAIAIPQNPAEVHDEILNIGAVQGTVVAELGMAIKKNGRTTGFTTGAIEQTDVTVNVQYGEGRTALFTDQLLAGAMSQGGDSGSAVLDENNRLTGLLFAGSGTATVINRIEHVFSALGVTL